jgi:hypothetical protein
LPSPRPPFGYSLRADPRPRLDARSAHPARPPHRAPIFVEAFDFAAWIQRLLGPSPQPLARAIAGHALALVEAVALALKQNSRRERLTQADELLVRLRIELRLAGEIGLLDMRRAQHGLAQLESIGRQLGGWQRADAFDSRN